MQGFDLEHLRTLVAAVEAGSLSAASPRRFLSQSSLSEHLQRLEERAGQPLLLRSKTGVQATAAGERLLAYARQILALSDQAWRDMHDVQVEGEVHLAITDYFLPAELMAILARLGELYPQLRLRTTIGKSDDIEAQHQRGAFDLAIVMNLPQTARKPALNRRVLRVEPLLWMGSAAFTRIHRGKPVQLALLPESCSLHKLARRLLDSHATPHVVAHVASGVSGLRAAIAAGLGVGCLNASAMDPATMTPLRHALLAPLPNVEFVLLTPAAEEGASHARLAAMADVIAEALAT